MNRRSNAVSGWVNFPVEDPAWRSTHEGGMVVKLVVVELQDRAGPEFAQCCGATVVEMLNEALVGDDQRPHPVDTYDEGEGHDVDVEQILAYDRACEAWRAYHYPRLYDESCPSEMRYLSIPYLASVVLGSTGWSGANVETGDLWQCRCEDLTQKGRELYAQVAALYPRARLHLLTFLDT